MLKIKEDKWSKYGGWVFVIPLALQLVWDGITGRPYDSDFVQLYLFGGFMAVVALLCARKIGPRS